MLEKYYNLYLPLNQKNERMICSVFQTLVAVETTQKRLSTQEKRGKSDTAQIPAKSLP